ncbi:MAG: TVP38/TMEM64 family protein [Nitrococcus sp.]|nr:TVP38/TMEM64 family protein [Nitrococcus sp.]
MRAQVGVMGSGQLFRATLALGPILACGAAYLLLPGLREEVNQVVGWLLHDNYEAVRAYILSFGLWAPVISLALMLLQAIASPIPAFAVSIANGLAFGPWWGAVLSLVGRALAATLCFFIARALGRDAVETIVGRKAVRRSETWFEEWGTQTVLFTRLIPFFPFDLISYAAGLSRLRFDKFMLATVIGETPASFIYAWVGARAPDYIWLLLLINGVIFLAVLATTYLLKRRA